MEWVITYLQIGYLLFSPIFLFFLLGITTEKNQTFKNFIIGTLSILAVWVIISPFWLIGIILLIYQYIFE